MPKRPLLVVGAGAIVITALEGIACGNPVSPKHRVPMEVPKDAAPDSPEMPTADGGVDTPETTKP